MQHILYLTHAKALSVETDCLAVTSLVDEKQLIHPQDTLAIIVENIYCQITIPALLLCVDHQIPVLLCDHTHQPRIYCLDYYQHTELRQCLIEQINWLPTRQKAAWISIIHHKLQHQINLLNSLPNTVKVVASIHNYQQTLQSRQITESQINGIESTSARLYFNELFGNHFKRFAEDTLNAALNYGYSLIRALIIMAIVARGLHPTLGIWHHSIRNRFNLADDLIETLRPLVDQQVKRLNLPNNQQLTQEQRSQLLAILQTTVYWQQKPYHLRTAIDFYINDFIAFMNQKTDIINPIQLNFEQYEPD